MIWIIGIAIYLLIGIGLLFWIAYSEDWGALIFHIAIPFILLYPYFLIRDWLSK
jgi:hypothetical protein